VRRNDNLTTSCADCLEIWEPLTPAVLRACPGLHRNFFTSYVTLVILVGKFLRNYINVTSQKVIFIVIIISIPGLTLEINYMVL
jgi:uncharacterized protein YqhQ